MCGYVVCGCVGGYVGGSEGMWVCVGMWVDGWVGERVRVSGRIMLIAPLVLQCTTAYSSCYYCDCHPDTVCAAANCCDLHHRATQSLLSGW